MAKANRTITAAVLSAWALASSTSEGAETATIVLHLANHAGVDAPHLAMARTRAEGVFKDVGVRLVWLGTLGKPDDRACTALHLSVMLLSTDHSTGAGGEGPGNQVLGIADRAGGTAFIYPVRIGDLAERTRRRTGELLGLVIAHEVGHLLLAPGHSQGGIMARSMETDPARTFALFSSAQARSIRQFLAGKARDCGERISSQP